MGICDGKNCHLFQYKSHSLTRMTKNRMRKEMCIYTLKYTQFEAHRFTAGDSSSLTHLTFHRNYGRTCIYTIIQAHNHRHDDGEKSDKCSSEHSEICHPQRNYKYLGPPICFCNSVYKRQHTGQCKSCNVIINVPIRNLCVAKTVTSIQSSGSFCTAT